MIADRPLRFCLISTFYPPYSFGGDGIFVQRLANALAERGHHVEVIHSVDAYRLAGGGAPARAEPDHPSVVRHGVESRFGALAPLAVHQTGYPVFAAATLNRILAQGFDVIHYHNISLVGGPGLLRLGRAIKLYTLHEYWLICPTHVLFKYNQAACVEPHCLPCTLSYRRPPQLWRSAGLVQAAARHVNLFLAPTKFSIDMHRRRGLDARFALLPPFVPPPLPEEGATVQRDDPYFLFVGRLEKLKGLHTLIPIFRTYRRARLLIAGEGSYEAELREMADGCENVEFLGSLSRQELQPLYRGARALLLPSLCYEVFPLVCVEAMQLSTPAVARNIGALPEVIESSGGGLTYESDDELHRVLDRLLDEPGLRDRLGARGHQAYETGWTTEAHLRRYFGLIDELSGTRGAPSLANAGG